MISSTLRISLANARAPPLQHVLDVILRCVQPLLHKRPGAEPRMPRPPAENVRAAVDRHHTAFLAAPALLADPAARLCALTPSSSRCTVRRRRPHAAPLARHIHDPLDPPHDRLRRRPCPAPSAPHPAHASTATLTISGSAIRFMRIGTPANAGTCPVILNACRLAISAVRKPILAITQARIRQHSAADHSSRPGYSPLPRRRRPPPHPRTARPGRR